MKVDHKQLLGAAAAKRKLLAYSVALMPDYHLAIHHRLIAKKLEQVAKGEIKRLMIFLPPRHGKSQLVSTFFPSWYLGNNPKKQIIFTSYSQDVATDFGRKVRNLMTDGAHQFIFPGVSITEDSASSKRFHTPQGGVYYAVGAGGPITSRGADIAIIDDITKGRAEAESPTIKKKIQEWYQSTLYTRLMPGGSIVLVQTRWTEDDLPGWLLSQKDGDTWEVLSLPAISEDDKALWPERYPIDVLRNIKKAIGTYDFEALYQQRPSPRTGGMVKRNWWKFYTALPDRFDQIIQSWDMAFKETDHSDYVVGQVWGQVGASKYLLDQVRGRMDFVATIQAVKTLSAKWPSSHLKLIEDKANGPAIISTLKNELSGIVAVEPQGSKVSRLSAASPQIEAGNVYLPDSSVAHWVHDFIEEFSQFPKGVHDDQVDAASQALVRFETQNVGEFSENFLQSMQSELIAGSLGGGVSW